MISSETANFLPRMHWLSLKSFLVHFHWIPQGFWAFLGAHGGSKMISIVKCLGIPRGFGRDVGKCSFSLDSLAIPEQLHDFHGFRHVDFI